MCLQRLSLSLAQCYDGIIDSTVAPWIANRYGTILFKGRNSG
jgi:hypothetical protein